MVKKENLREYLGLPTAFHDKQQGNEAPGVVTGLAWTELGGEILFVESSVSKGKGVLSMTGNLGDVMKESAQIAWHEPDSSDGRCRFLPFRRYHEDLPLHGDDSVRLQDGEHGSGRFHPAELRRPPGSPVRQIR